MLRRIGLYLPFVLILLPIPFRLCACGTLQVGIESTPSPTLPTATYEVPPKDLCQGYLELLVSAEGLEERAVVTSYRCRSAWIDSTGQSPARSPTLIVGRGSPIALRLTAEEQPLAIELRLYPGAGVAASFLRWPEELPSQVEPVDRLQPEPSADLSYRTQAESGEYTLVCRVTWEGDVDVFYAISFVVKDPQ